MMPMEPQDALRQLDMAACLGAVTANHPIEEVKAHTRCVLVALINGAAAGKKLAELEKAAAAKQEKPQ